MLRPRRTRHSGFVRVENENTRRSIQVKVQTFCLCRF